MIIVVLLETLTVCYAYGKLKNKHLKMENKSCPWAEGAYETIQESSIRMQIFCHRNSSSYRAPFNLHNCARQCYSHKKNTKINKNVKIVYHWWTNEGYFLSNTDLLEWQTLTGNLKILKAFFIPLKFESIKNQLHVEQSSISLRENSLAPLEKKNKNVFIFNSKRWPNVTVVIKIGEALQRN